MLNSAPSYKAPSSKPVQPKKLAVSPLGSSEFCYGLPGAIEPLGPFDPLGFTKSADVLEVDRLREAELTHGRVAMLASAGFLVQEGFHPLFTEDGGPAIQQIPYLQVEQPGFLVALSMCITAIEALRISKGWAPPTEENLKDARAGGVSQSFQRLRADYVPGDLGFDPLNLKPKDPAAFRAMQEKELSNGRLAMLAAAGFLAQETITQQPWLATLAVKGEEARSADPVMQEAVALDPDEDKFCYGLPGAIAPFGNGFDPLGFVEGVKRDYTDPKAEMMRFRESELTHGRVGMLASAGFLTQESFHPLFGGQIEGPAINMIPQLPSAYWISLAAGIWIAELARIR